MTKKDQILQYLQKFPEAKPKELAERMMGEISGFSVKPQEISTIKSQEKAKTNGGSATTSTPKKAGRPAASPAPVANVHTMVASQPANPANFSSVVTTVKTIREAREKLGEEGFRTFLKVAAEIGGPEQVQQLANEIG